MEEFTVNCPDELTFENQVFSIDFHPQKNILATGISDGNTFLYEYSPEGNKILSTYTHHSGSSVRCVAFAPDGNTLYTAGGDKSFRAVDLATGKVAFENSTSKEPINAVEVFENYIFTGDDSGCVKIWDTRKPGKAPAEITENWDYISDLCCYSPQNTLFATGGDERMSVIDFRKGKLIEVSQDQEDELLCVQVVKGGRKVVVGSQLGVLLLWTWGQWQDTTDRYPGHPESIECMVAIDDDTVITGSADGVIRIVNILPNRMIGVVGEHDDDMSVQRMAITYDKGYLGSCSDDNKIKFWNIGFLFEEDGEDADEEQQEDEEQAQDFVGNFDGNEEEVDADEANDDEDSIGSDDSSDMDDEEGEEEDDDDDEDDEDDEEGMKSKVRDRGRSSRIPSKRKRNTANESSDSSEEQGATNGDEDEANFEDDEEGEEPEEEGEERVKPDAKQKLSTLLTSLPVGQKLSLQERRQLIKKQRQLKKTVKQEKKEKREVANATRQAQIPQKEKAQNNKKRKVGEHNEVANFFSDL